MCIRDSSTVAPFDISVLILGPNGAGKESVAQRIHYIGAVSYTHLAVYKRQGVQSVAVLMDGTVTAYDVTPTNAPLTSTDPHYWTNHKDITVTAWWPYTAGETSPPPTSVPANNRPLSKIFHHVEVLFIILRFA